MKNRQWMSKLLWVAVIFMIGMGLVFDVQSQPRPIMNTWQGFVMSNGAPRIRYVDLDTRTSISFTYINSKDCTDLKLHVGKFVSPKKASLVDTSFRGGFLIDDKKFLFSAQVPSEMDAGPLKEFSAIWELDEEFITALFSAKKILWTDSEQEVNHFVEVKVEGLPKKLNRLMVICHDAHIRTVPINGIIIDNPTSVKLD